MDWVAVSGSGITYEVYVALASSNFSATPTTTGISGVTTTVTGLLASTLYKFKVLARSATLGVSGPSNEAFARPLDIAWNPDDRADGAGQICTFSNSNKTVTHSATVGQPATGSLVRTTGGGRSTGKWYWEVVAQGVINYLNNNSILDFGVTRSDVAQTLGAHLRGGFIGGVSNISFALNPAFLLMATNNSADANAGTNCDVTTNGTVGDVYGFAMDLDARKIWMHKNGVYTKGDPSAGTNWILPLGPPAAIVQPALWLLGDAACTGRFKAADMQYAIPTGFSAWG